MQIVSQHSPDADGVPTPGLAASRRAAAGAATMASGAFRSHSDISEAPVINGSLRDSMLQIRRMRSDDRPELIEIWVASWRETMPKIDFEARRDWISAVLADPSQTTLVAVQAAPPGSVCLLGFVSLRGRLLHQVVVAPMAKGAGVAAALLDAAKSHSATGMDLEVNRDNPRALRFYEREGFVVVGAASNPTSGLATLKMTWRALPADP